MLIVGLCSAGPTSVMAEMLKLFREATTLAIRLYTVSVVVMFGRAIGRSHSPLSVPFTQTYTPIPSKPYI